MKTTQEYFNMGIDELLETDTDGYTREERKIFDAGFKVYFFDSEKEYHKEKQSCIEWYKNAGFKPVLVLKTINERIAIAFN